MRGMKRLKTTIVSLFLAAAMIMGEAGAVFAAAPQQKEAGTRLSEQDDYGGNKPDVHDVDMNTADNVAEITRFAAWSVNSISSPGSIVIRFSGLGAKFDIYINGKLYKEIINDSASVDNPAPYKNDILEEFYGILYGETYKIEVIPYAYTETGYVAGTAVSDTETVRGFYASMYASGATTIAENGYSKPEGIKLEFNVVWMKEALIEVQRREGKGAWKTIAKVSGSEYLDKTASLGKTYQYRVRSLSRKNDYGETTQSQWWYIQDYDRGKIIHYTVPNADLSLSYEGTGSGVSINVCSIYAPDIVSGYEIYRSTKESKGYKKVAKLAGTTYVDKKVKKGAYYYKARAYYYDTSTGKTYYGAFSDPQYIRLALGSIYVNVKQTGNRQVTLTWNKIKGVSDYEVWYKSDIKGDVYRLYKSTKGTKMKVSGLSDNINYIFTVRAKKKGSVYYASNDCSYRMGFKIAVPYVAKRKVVSNKAKTAVTIKSTIKWDRIYGAKKIKIIGVVDGYFLAGDYVPPQEKVLKTLKGSATSYTLTINITEKNKYEGYDEIKVVAVSGDEELAADVNGFNNLNETSKLTVKRAGNKGGVISWKAVQGATSYKVYRQSPYGHSIYIGTTDKCTYKDLGVTPGVTYTYSIVARNDELRLSSDESGVVTKAYTHKLGTPKIKSAVNTAKSTVTIKWSKVSLADSYVIYRATSKNGKYKKLATISKGGTSYIDKKVKKGKSYYYKVKAKAKNAAGLTVLSKLSAYKAVRVKK